MNLMKKEDILKARVTDFREFQSKILGGTVRFKKLSAAGYDVIESVTVKHNANGVHTRDLSLFRSAFIVASQVDEDGRLLWGVDDIESVGALPRDVVTELFGFALECNPAVASHEDVKAELSKNQSESSSTD